MEYVIRRAKEVGNSGEVPVSAVILNQKGICIGFGSNNRQSKNNPLGHAELIALRQASLVKNDWRFNECTLIVNLEPCLMCASALIQARMGKVIFGATDPKRGGLGGTIDISKHKSAHHKLIIEKRVLELKASEQISNWFKEIRD
tara:strand:+ start:3673 stop:4107 length:435 start_codon:yes stop_codon:yes gene_type:complete